VTGLLDPQTAREVWPSARELVEFEALLVTDALQQMVDTTANEAESHLRTRYDLQEHEVREIMGLAKRLAAHRVDLDGARATCILQMQKAIAEAREAVDHRAVIAGIERMARLYGLDRAAVEDGDINDMAQSVKVVARERKKLPPKTD
jgi:hypothetical protein